MIVSLLFMFAVARATWRCVQERWVPGVALGLLRAVLMLGGLWFALQSDSILVVPRPLALPVEIARASVTTPVASPSATIMLGVIQLAGPLVSLLAMVLAYLRYRDVPAKEEEQARRPFSAWLPAGVLDIVYWFIMFIVATLSADWYSPR